MRSCELWLAAVVHEDVDRKTVIDDIDPVVLVVQISAAVSRISGSLQAHTRVENFVRCLRRPSWDLLVPEVGIRCGGIETDIGLCPKTSTISDIDHGWRLSRWGS